MLERYNTSKKFEYHSSYTTLSVTMHPKGRTSPSRKVLLAEEITIIVKTNTVFWIQQPPMIQTWDISPYTCLLPNVNVCVFLDYF
jgi:hypothetical protein